MKKRSLLSESLQPDESDDFLLALEKRCRIRELADSRLQHCHLQEVSVPNKVKEDADIPSSDARVTKRTKQMEASNIPLNDYAFNYVETGERAQNFLLTEPGRQHVRFEGYPRLNRLDQLKKELVNARSHVPLGLKWQWNQVSSLQPRLGATNKFDTILLNVPKDISIPNLAVLKVDELAAAPCFLFFLIRDSTAANLESARALLVNWGFRRAEDIVWIKTNTLAEERRKLRPDRESIFVNTKEHCLMGIKGTARRSTDPHLIHCNVDTDVIVAEEANENGKRVKPEELYTVIENFCQGLRRLEIFCSKQRRGWVSMDQAISLSTYDPVLYHNLWLQGHLLGMTPEIDALRPKSPPPR